MYIVNRIYCIILIKEKLNRQIILHANPDRGATRPYVPNGTSIWISVFTNALPRAGTTVSYALKSVEKSINILSKYHFEFFLNPLTCANQGRQPVQILWSAQMHARSIWPNGELFLVLTKPYIWRKKKLEIIWKNVYCQPNFSQYFNKTIIKSSNDLTFW